MKEGSKEREASREREKGRVRKEENSVGEKSGEEREKERGM